MSIPRLPIAYHDFSRPLGYHRTLKLQDKIVELRLQAKKDDPSSELARRDVILLLGELNRFFPFFSAAPIGNWIVERMLRLSQDLGSEANLTPISPPNEKKPLELTSSSSSSLSALRSEHRPTFTTGRRDSLPTSLARIELEKDRLAHAGADWAVTRRGGQVTYHGPGQVVGYLFFDLSAMKVSPPPPSLLPILLRKMICI